MFITLEGIDRSGKTTQAARLAEALGPRTVRLREPGGTDAGERIRELLKDGSIELDPRAELLLICAARAELCERVIEPALAEGRDVVCDRFMDSTVAYQGIGRGLGAATVQSLNEVAVAGREPDLTILLRVEPSTAAERPGDSGDRFEAEGLEFQRIVSAAYDEIAARHPSRIQVVDGDGDPGEVHARVLGLVEARR